MNYNATVSGLIGKRIIAVRGLEKEVKRSLSICPTAPSRRCIKTFQVGNPAIEF